MLVDVTAGDDEAGNEDIHDHFVRCLVKSTCSPVSLGIVSVTMLGPVSVSVPCGLMILIYVSATRRSTASYLYALEIFGLHFLVHLFDILCIIQLWISAANILVFALE